MGPAQLSYQRYDNLFLGEDFGKLHHPAQVLLTEARAILQNQLSCQQYDNLPAVSCSFFAENLINDSLADAPVQQRKTCVDSGGNTLSCLRDELAKILDQGWRYHADLVPHCDWLCLLARHNSFSNTFGLVCVR